MNKIIITEKDGLFEATHSDYPDLFDYGETHQEALELIQDSVNTLESIKNESEKG